MITTDEYLLEKGYKKYDAIPYIDSDYIVARFQKRFDDDFGKKYFIDALKWSHEYIPYHRRDKYWEPFNYEYEAQITMFENGKALDFHFHSSWTLDEVEDFMENFFEKMTPNYYESWDGDRRIKSR